YTNPDNIKESWPRDIVKESENVSGQKSEEGSQMKVEGEYMGKRDEMTLEVVEKQQNKRLVTRQTEGPFQSWESIQEFQSFNGAKASLFFSLVILFIDVIEIVTKTILIQIL
ncbi:MAG TPA: hypothetical protein VD815_09870, partial [Candidatus Saccharimonadales bacterium]|nr:hypothetical protein [Candidatus Saccharimonadales bacterium]